MSPWSVEGKGKRRLSTLGVLVAMAIGFATAFSSAQAAGGDEPTKAVANAIDSFTNRLSSVSDALGNYSNLANNLPLTDLAPGSPDALDLSNLLKDKLGTLAGDYADMTELAAAIEQKDDDTGALKIQFGNPDDLTGPALAPGQADVTSTESSITIPIHAQRHVDQKLHFDFTSVEMNGGSLGIDFAVDTTLTFHVDRAAVTDATTASPNSLSLDPAAITLSADATGKVNVFTARFGFTDVKVSTDDPTTPAEEAASLHAKAQVALQDPDSVGGITLDEWTSHALSELASATLQKGNPSGDDLDVKLFADASLVNGDAYGATPAAPDASVRFQKADLSAGGAPTVTPAVSEGLQSWLNITAGDVANGLASFVSSLAASQGLGNAPLPLLGKSLTEIFDGIKPLSDYTDQLLNATVGCGTVPGNSTTFPTGPIDNLASGTPVYCRASTQLPVTSNVQWAVPTGVNAMVTANGTNANTLATNPTEDVTYTMTGAGGNFSAEVTWTSGSATKKAISRPGTAQELFQRIAAAAGLSSTLASDLNYDASKKALTLRLKKENFDPGGFAVDANIGDLLRNTTNLTALKEASGSLVADVGDIDLDVTFGVLLTPNTSDITPIRGTANGTTSGSTLEDTSADFTDGDNDPILGQVVTKTSSGANPKPTCTITAITQTTLTCAASWASGDTYDVDGGLIDRFYVQVNPSAPELSVGTLSVTGNATLKGKVGFVDVEAGGDGSKNTANPGQAFSIAPVDGSTPVLAVNVAAPNAFKLNQGGSETTIPNAVGVGEVLGHLDSDHVTAVCKLKASAGLGITAKINNQTLAGGGVSVSWPTVFENGGCTPDFSTLDVDADADFDINLRDFDPFPSVSGKHTPSGPNDHLHDDTKDFTKVGFKIGNPASATGGNNLQNLTLKNKTTGASCTILTVSADELGCTLSGGTRASGTDNNKWLQGDEYEVEGNALAWLGYILDNLDLLVDQLDQIDPGLTDKEIPLIGISTKDLVGKIKSIKQTTDELRGSPLATVECFGKNDGTNPATDLNNNPFNITQLPRGTELFCRAVTTVAPTSVEWTVLKSPASPNNVTIDPPNATSLDTVGANPSAFVKVIVGDPTQVPVSGPRPLIAISDWRVNVKFVDAAGDHNTEYPTAGPPRSLQELSDRISEKLGVPGVIKFEVLDLPTAAATAPRRSGEANDDVVADNVLEDEDEDFTTGDDTTLISVGNLLINKTDDHYCTVTNVADHVLTCAAGSNMEWDENDEYEVVGDNTKDLVVRLGVGFCAEGGSITCEDGDQEVAPVSVPLNVANSFADIVSVETTGDLDLYFRARGQLDIGIPIKLGVPSITVLDTSGFSAAASVGAEDVGLSAALGPITAELGTLAAGGVGVARLGAHLSLESNEDDVSNNKTQTFGDFLSNAAGNFEFDGDNQECDEPDGAPVEAQGHACALLSVSALGADFGELKIECDVTQDPICDVTLPPGLQDLIEGSELDWTLLVGVLQQILTKLQATLDGAAQGVKLPLIGNALDAGADVVGAFNDNVVTPFNTLVNQIKTAADQDGDGSVDAYDASKLAQKYIFDNLGPDGTGADVLLDTNGSGGDATIEDVVVTPLCGAGPTACANGAPITQIKDFRITFKLGQAINGDVPFDVGLEGLPLSLKGGIHGGGSWSLLVDVGISLQQGPYIVANGKKGVDDTGPENRPFDTHCSGTDPGDPFDCYLPLNYLQDDNTNFGDVAEYGMWLEKTSGSGSGSGCRVTKIETHKLYCDDFGTDTPGPLTWFGTDGYKLVARHAPDTPNTGGLSELQLKGIVQMGPKADACDASPSGIAYLAGYGDDPANERCLEGKIAFLKVNVTDRDGELDESAECDALDLDTGEKPTAICLSASLDFKKDGDSRVGFSDLTSGNFGFTPKLAGAVNMDVRIRTGLNVGQSAGFPSVLGKFHLYWGFVVTPGTPVDYDDNGSATDPLEVSFDGLALDVGTFITQFLGPMIKQVKEVTNPLMPVVEMLQGEVPIISDLSKLVGQGPVTVLDLLEAISGNDLSLLRSILQMIKFVNSLPDNESFVIPLGGGGPGSFDVDTERATESQPIPEEASKGISGAVAGSDLMNNLAAGDGTNKYDGAKDAPAECDRGATFGVCGLTFPFFSNATQIFGVLMGKDATLIHYDAGSFGAGAGFGFCFPPILIGPVPVQICIGGEFRVEGRFAMGYDTSGLRKVLAGGTGTHLLDGIFFDDYDSNGVDVPEVKFTGKVYAEGAVSVYIFKVGIRGEIIFTTGLNLHEDAPQDGKLRIEEVIAKIFNPICLFDIEGKIEAALSAFVKIDLFITSVEFSIQIVKVTLLEFDLSVCNVKPVLAHNETDGNVEKLVLNMGSDSLRQARGIAAGETNEKFIVRQMESAGGKTRFSVSAFGIQQDYFLSTSKVGTDQAWLIANADGGEDVISLLPGSAQGEEAKPNEQKPSIPFTLWADISAGPENDEITTADGNDIVDGDPGNDKLSTGAGADAVHGGTENDQIDAGPGNDTNVHGEGHDDIVNGGPGADTVNGDAGNDVVAAGPGEDPNGPVTDTLIGNAGDDTLSADGGADILFGDESGLSFSCTGDTGNDGTTSTVTGNGRDSLIGGPGNNQMHGGNNDDTLDGGDGNDTMCGGGGKDEMKGGAGADPMSGNGGNDNMVGSTDGGAGDVMNGNGGRDFMIGDDGTLTRDGSDNVSASVAGGTAGGTDQMNGGPNRDFMWGQGAVDTMNGNAGNDYMLGGPADDVMNGNENDDEMYGEDGVDTMHGNAGNDYMRGGVGTDTMDGDADTDEMYGDNDRDTMRGGAGDDLMRGGGGDDYIEGNGNATSARPLNDSSNPLANSNFDLHLEKDSVALGNWSVPAGAGSDGDVIYGDAGQDDVIGGSNSAAADDGDTILGNTEQDVIAGDNATITRPGGGPQPDGTLPRTVNLNDPGGTSSANSGPDYIQGNLGNDDIYAGGDADLVHGDEGDDYVEGNGGSDGADVLGGDPVADVGLYGDAHQDDLIGGTSQGSGGVADGNDDIWGGDSHDVIAGDNATITRTGGGTCNGFVCNTFRNSAPLVQNVVIRGIQIWDVATTGSTPTAGTSGNDTANGQADHDRIYGQGGGDDLKGGANDDFVFGNDGADTIRGGADQDDLVGGTGRTSSADANSATDLRLDQGDLIYGEDGYDAISGDNSRIVRQTLDADTGPNSDQTGTWKSNTFNAAVDRIIALMDIATTSNDAPLTNGTSGGDRLLGGNEDDVVYGQGDNDGISGGSGQDLLEGNANHASSNAPNPDPTAYNSELLFPSTFVGDVIHGDAGADDIGGGTGRIYRMESGNEVQDPASGVDGRKDAADTIFGDGGGDAIAGDNTVIERALSAGAWILDDLHDPDALDVVRRIMRERDVATTADANPLTNGTSGGDTIYGNDGVDVAYGQGGGDTIQGNASDDHLEGNAGADTVFGNEGRDDIVGGTGRTFSNDESTAADGRIDNQSGQDTLNGGDGAGGVAANDDDTVIGDNGTIDRLLGALPAAGNAELGRLPFNGAWQETTWDAPNILRVVRLLDVARSDAAAPDTNGTNGADTIRGEVGNDVLFGQGGGDTITASVGEDYVEGNNGADSITGGLGQDDVAGGGSARTGVLDANRNGRLDDDRTGENLTDGNDTIVGDEGDGAVGDGDVAAGDNARIQRKLNGDGAWRDDAQRGTRLRDVFLFDIRIVGSAEPGNADASESGFDAISGNGGNDILLGQDNGAQYNGQFDNSQADRFAREQGDPLDVTHPPNCQDSLGPGQGTISAGEEAPSGDNDDDDLPDLNDPQCRTTNPTGDTINGEGGQDYIEGNSGSDNLTGGHDEDDVVGGSSSNTGHLNVILPPGDRDAGFAPTAVTPANRPTDLNDGHDVIQGNDEDDTLVGDNAFVDRYLAPSTGDWITITGDGPDASAELDVPNPEPAKAASEDSSLVRRDVVTRETPESAAAFGNDFVKGDAGQDDIYGLLGNDWLEGNANEDAIVGDMGKVVDNVIGVDDAIDPPDPAADQFITPQQPFLGATINRSGWLKREVTLYAFNSNVAGAGIGHDVALGNDGNDSIHTGPGEDLANGNAGDDRIFLGDNFTGVLANKNASQNRLAHDRVDAGWGGGGYDHVWGGYGADYLDVRPRSAAAVPGLVPASDPETWFQVAGAEASQNGNTYNQDNFDDKDYLYGGWDQDTMQANIGDNGPHIGDRNLDWGGSYNGYYLCPSTYGDWVSTRAIAPGLIEFLQGMSQADGATQTATAGTSGFRETAIVFANEVKDNTKPIHPDTPAHFTCGPGIVGP